MFNSKSAQTSLVETNTVNTSQNTNVEDSDGIIVGSEGDVNIYSVSSDFNAIGSATDLAQRSVDFAQTIGQDAMRLSLQQSEVVAGSYARALDYQHMALQTATDRNEDALSYVAENARGTLETVTDTFKSMFSGVTDFIGGLQRQEQTTLGDTVAAINTLAVNN